MNNEQHLARGRGPLESRFDSGKGFAIVVMTTDDRTLTRVSTEEEARG